MVPLARGAGERLKFVSMLNSRKSNCCKDSIIQDGATAPIQHVVPSELCLRITSYGMKDERLGTSSSLWLDGANFLGTVDAQKLAKGLQAALEMTAMARS